MTHWFDHSLVLASDYRVPDPADVVPLLQRSESALAALGAHHVVVYTSISDPGRVLLIMAMNAREPVLEVMRSRVFFDWFDAAGIEDIPAVFAGDLIERLTFEPGIASEAPQAVAVVITPVKDVASLVSRVNSSDFRAAGIRRMLVFSAFDNPNEVMLLFGLRNENTAATWLTHSEATASWLQEAGIGAYPPLFVGRYRHLMRVGDIDDDVGEDVGEDVGTDEGESYALMFVCLCCGVTNKQVADVVAAGATTTRDVAQACGAGSECARCRCTVRAIIDAQTQSAATT